VGAPKELAHRYSRRVEVLAMAAALAGEDIDIKPMRMLVNGYNYSVTALECFDCTLSRLV
jgi:hypothetical protein